MDKLLKKSEVADLLGVSPNTIARWVQIQLIPHIKIGKNILRFKLSEIEDFLKQRSVGRHEVHNSRRGGARV